MNCDQGLRAIGAFEYDGKAKTVLVSGLPSGVTVASYAGNSATEPGKYTAHVALAYDEQLYDEPTIPDLKWEIKKPYRLTLRPNSTKYGTVSGGNVSPIYGGEEISNDGDHKLNNYNYFLEDNVPISSIDKPNCALAAEERFLTRFEIYRLLLNSNRELAMCYVAGNADGARTKMAKWVLDTDVAPYPILKPQGKYTSVINYDPAKAPATKEQIKTLDNLGVNVIQGFYFDRPLSHDDMTERLKSPVYDV